MAAGTLFVLDASLSGGLIEGARSRDARAKPGSGFARQQAVDDLARHELAAGRNMLDLGEAEIEQIELVLGYSKSPIDTHSPPSTRNTARQSPHRMRLTPGCPLTLSISSARVVGSAA